MGKTIQLSFGDDVYFKLVEHAARQQMEVDNFIKEVLQNEVGIAKEQPSTDSFAEFLVSRLDLKPGTKGAANVIGVAERIRQGKSWEEAVADRAREYAAQNPNVESPPVYEDTVRDSCTRRVGMSTNEFKRRIRELVDEFENQV